jgi:threonine aldolase
MAERLAAGLTGLPGVRLAWPTEANEVFPILPRAIDEALRAAGAVYHPWSDRSLPFGQAVRPDEVLARLVTAFNTEPESIEALLAAARGS